MSNYKPEHYFVHLEPDLNTFKVNGYTEIKIKAEELVKEITLHAHEIAIWSVSVKKNGKEEKRKFSLDPSKQELSVNLQGEVGEFTLRIEFISLINEQLVGLYRSKYEQDGETKYLATTQFEEEHARQVFPCFDHPSYKTTFDVEMVIDKQYSAIANTRIKEEKEQDGGKKLVVFKTSPKMCTYLLYFGIGDFEYIESSSDTIRYRIATTPGKTQYAEYALDFGRKSVEYGEQYSGIPFPIDKMDQIAVSDFAFGAMENYGAITYRENLLLVYPGITSKAGIERIAEVIAHEVAHQWFGNLVSPADWKYIWLNESFATLFGYAITDHYHPEWEIFEGFLAYDVDEAFERDSLIETFPIELPGKGEKVKITAATAPIIYSKGGAILQMINGYLSDDKFKKGIATFLDKFKFDIAESADCWQAFEEGTGEPIAEMMKTWVFQPGYPFITVERNDDVLTLNQKRFSFLSNNSKDIWMIPLTVSFYDDNKLLSTEKYVFKRASMTLRMPPEATSFKFNYEQSGFYKVKYPKENLHALGKLVKKKILSPRDRFGLHNDMYSFVRSGDYSVDDYLDFLEYYQTEDDYLPLIAMSSNLVHIYKVVESRRERVSGIGFNAFSEVLKNIGYEPKEGESNKTSNLRSALLMSSFLFNDEGVAAFGLQKFEEYMNGEKVNPDILASTMRIGLTQKPEAFTWLTNKHEDAETSEPEKINILAALGHIEEEDLLKNVFEYTLEKVPDRNKIYPVMFLGQNIKAADSGLMWKWYQENIKKLEKLHPMHYERVITSVIGLGGLERYDEMKDFFTKYMDEHPDARDTIKMTLERLEINLKLRKS